VEAKWASRPKIWGLRGITCWLPNLLTPHGQKRDLAAALEGAERWKKLMSRQMYKIKQELADDDGVAGG
jgi:hypothetical protein